MQYFTGKGDQGKTSLADGHLISKGDLSFDLIGDLDETSAYLGLAISFSQDPNIKNILRIIQGHISKLMGFIAGVKVTDLEKDAYLTNALECLEDNMNVYGDYIDDPKGFIFSGRSCEGAAIDIARTVTRRAERHAARYIEKYKAHNTNMLTYLNRLSSFLYIFRLFIDRKSNSQG